MKYKSHIIRYLMGSGTLKGKWFNEGPPDGVNGMYWWRNELAKYVDKINKRKSRR